MSFLLQSYHYAQSINIKNIINIDISFSVSMIFHIIGLILSESLGTKLSKVEPTFLIKGISEFISIND